MASQRNLYFFDILRTWKVIVVCAFRGWVFRLRRWLGWRKPDAHAIQSMYDSLEPSHITYSQVWEDSVTLRQALKIRETDHVVCVCSGGDNALALLLDNPRAVVAVDFSPAQIAVAELKKAAIKHLTYELFTCLIGLGPDAVKGIERTDIYRQLLRPHLDARLIAFWDIHVDVIAGGLIHAGIYEQYFRSFGLAVRPLAHSKDAVHKLLSMRDAQARRTFYDDVWDTLSWRMLCRLYFGDVLVGRCTPFYERTNVNVGDHFLSRLSHVMRNIPTHDNYYLEYVLTGELSGDYGLPEYLQHENFDHLKSNVDRINFQEGDLTSALEKSASSFDVIDMSNIFDFTPQSSHAHCMEIMLSKAKPGARICHWTFVPVSNDQIDYKSFGSNSEVDMEMSKTVSCVERAWFYQTFVLQTVEAGEAHIKPPPKQTNGYTHKNGFAHRNGFCSSNNLH